MAQPEQPTPAVPEKPSVPQPEPTAVNSLEHLGEVMQGLGLPRPFLPVDQAWFDLFHGESLPPTGPTARAFASIPQHMSRLMEHGKRYRDQQARTARLEAQRRAYDRAAQAGMDQQQRAAAEQQQQHREAPDIPALEPCRGVVQQVYDSVINPVAGEFMAPMCCPLTRTALPEIAAAAKEYLVTEKSDGLRAVCVALAVPSFPEWQAVGPAPDGGLRVLHRHGLFDTGVLEGARLEILGGTAAGTARPIALSTAAPGAYHLEMDAHDSSAFALVPGPADPTNPRPQAPVVRLRRVANAGRHLQYFFDRKMGVHLALAEYPFDPQLHSFILDGELVLTIPQKGQPPRCLYAVFDIFAHTPVRPPGSSAPAMPRLLQEHTMKERYALIDSVVVQPMLARSKAEAYPLPRGLVFLRKRMFTVPELPQLLAQLRPVPAAGGGHHYVYAPTLTFNDGLIFTPNRFLLTTGSHVDQYKWKWPGMLSIDFLLRVSKDDPGLTNMSLFYRQRLYGGDEAGHIFMGRERLLNPHGLRIPDVGEGAVFECCLVPDAAAAVPFVTSDRTASMLQEAEAGGSGSLAGTPTGKLGGNGGPPHGAGLGRLRWSIERLRKDKTEANSVITATSVLESMAENITLPVLLHAAGYHDVQQVLPPPLFDVVAGGQWQQAALAGASPLDLEAAAADIPAVTMGLRVANDGGASQALKLQWQAGLTSAKRKNAFLCNHRRVRECFGLGEPCPDVDPASRLIPKLLIALGNDGGCVGWSDLLARVRFSPARGRWEILTLDRKGRGSPGNFAQDVVAHLRAVACAHARGVDVDQIWASSAGPSADDAFPPNRVIAALPAGPLVATDKHYAERTEELRSGAARSALRRHNNWVKASLFETATAALLGPGAAAKFRDEVRAEAAADAAARRHLAPHRPLRLLDLCCGRGGDLLKYAGLPLGQLTLIDSCLEAVAEAAERYSVKQHLSTRSAKGSGVPAQFHVADCFDAAAVLPLLGDSAGAMDIVTCQFSMHYAFEAERRVRQFLTIVATALRPGGLFVATTTDSDVLAELRATAGPTGSAGNDCYTVTFMEDDACFGAPYRVRLEHSVEEAVEWTVDWPTFAALARDEYGLDVVHAANFREAATLPVLAEQVTAAKREKRPREDTFGDDSDDAEAEAEAGPTTTQPSGVALSEAERQTAELFRFMVLRKRSPPAP